MKISFFSKIITSLLLGFLLFQASGLSAQVLNQNPELDKKVEQFLEKHKYKWHDLNIPTADGKILYDLVIKNNYKNAVEIGTSTGHSAIWIAWALSKTGGKLITIEINESRHLKALANFKEAGLEKYIDARLDDAHKLVPRLNGPIDFVFCDADKGWYKNYFKDVEHEIVVGGCFTAHNISMKQNNETSIKDFLEYVKGLSNFQTTIENEISSGISISYKTGHR
jgi:caffeoyl-CoA O-methyltransferase